MQERFIKLYSPVEEFEVGNICTVEIKTSPLNQKTKVRFILLFLPITTCITLNTLLSDLLLCK